MKILISGAGVAGAALACSLARGGHDVVVVERDRAPRSSGNPVDVRGQAYDVVEQLGLLAQLRDVATRVRELVLVDATGRRVSSMPTRRSDRELEVPRADLCALLVEAARGIAGFRFDDTIIGLAQDDHGVDICFERARPDRFDVVVGADGLHSTVRRLAFGPETDFVFPLGIYIATVLVPGEGGRDDAVIMHNQPNAALALHPGSGRPGAGFLFRSSATVDPRDHDGVDELVSGVYRGMGWRAPELLGSYLAAGDRYFDAVSRVRVPVWSRGRVGLLGDAASCVSLFGEGSSAALAGAATLAELLVDAPREVNPTLLRYQATHAPLVRRGQRGAATAARLLIPATRGGLALRNRALRLAGHR